MPALTRRKIDDPHRPARLLSRRLKLESSIDTVAYDAVIGGYTEIVSRGEFTGEWLVFAKQDNINYYLTLGTHDEGDAEIWKRCQVCAAEFRELALLRENR